MLMITKKQKIIKILEKIVEVAICCLIFIIPFSKAGIEISGIIAIIVWLLLILVRCYVLHVERKMQPVDHEAISAPSKYLFSVTSLAYYKNRIFVAALLFFFVNFLSCLMSVLVMHSFKALFTKTFEYLLFFFIIVDIFSERKKLKVLGHIILVSISLICIDGIVQYFTGFDLIRRYPLTDFRISASFKSPNDFANYIVLFIPIFLLLIIYKDIKLRYRIHTASLFAISLFCLIFSRTRASWVGFLVGMVFLCFAYSKKIFVIFLIILISGCLVLQAPINNKVKKISDMEDLSITYRIIMWQEALNIIIDYPLLGAGLNTYTQVAPKYKVGPGYGVYPHNSYLHMFAEIGFLGMAMFLWFLWAILERGFRLLRSLRSLASAGSNDYILLVGIMSGLVAFLVNAFFDTTFYAIKLVSIFWIMCGILVAMCNIVEERI